jgi:hypothetical protein
MTCLLLISCSASKNDTSELIPALDRYRGNVYKIIKRAKREGYWPQAIDVFIISAKYRLISEHTLIEYYDQKMTGDRADELRVEVSHDLDKLLRERQFDKIFINLSKVYMRSISLSQEIEGARQRGVLQEALGGIGEKQHQTKVWLQEQYNLGLQVQKNNPL